MSKETTLWHRRNGVAVQLGSARQAIKVALKALKTVDGALKTLEGAKYQVRQAKKVSELKREGERPLPKRIVTILERAMGDLEKHEKNIRAVPVTKDERVTAKDKATRKRAAR